MPVPADQFHRLGTGFNGPLELVAQPGSPAGATAFRQLLATVAHKAHLETPALDSLAALIEGRIEPEQWTAAVTEPPRPPRKSSIRAA